MTHRPDDLDESVTDEELELAHDGTPTEFPVPAPDAAQDDVDDVDARILTLVAPRPATPHEAILNARHLRAAHVNVGIGTCLKTVRGPIYQLPALWPDANAAIEHGAPVHRIGLGGDYGKIPRAAVIGFPNEHLGHVTLGVGGGLNSTTDFHELGFEGIATIARTAEWCGATDVVWFEILNGVDVYPNPVKPKPHPTPEQTPDAWDLQERADFLARRMNAARANGQDAKADQLKRWHDRIIARIHNGK